MLAALHVVSGDAPRTPETNEWSGAKNKTDALEGARLQCYGGEARIRTGGKGFAGLCLTTWPLRRICKGPTLIGPGAYNGADNGARTRDPNLGKVVLYQLSHVRIWWAIQDLNL